MTGRMCFGFDQQPCQPVWRPFDEILSLLWDCSSEQHQYSCRSVHLPSYEVNQAVSLHIDLCNVNAGILVEH